MQFSFFSLIPQSQLSPDVFTVRPRRISGHFRPGASQTPARCRAHFWASGRCQVHFKQNCSIVSGKKYENDEGWYFFRATKPYLTPEWCTIIRCLRISRNILKGVNIVLPAAVTFLVVGRVPGSFMRGVKINPGVTYLNATPTNPAGTG